MHWHRSPFLWHLLLVVFVFIFSDEAHGQDSRCKKEVFAKFGYGALGEDEGSLGDGMVLGGGLSIPVTQRWDVAVEVHFQENRLFRGPGQFFSEGHSLLVGGSALYHFSVSRIQPYLRLGFSFARFNGARGFEPDDDNSFDTSPPDPGWRREGVQNFLGPEFGAGLRILVTERITIRPEFRLFAGGSGGYDPSEDVIEPGLFLTSATVGVAYQW